VTHKAWTRSVVWALTVALITVVTRPQIQAQMGSPKSPAEIVDDAHGATSSSMAQSALSTDRAINQALLTNNADALEALTADDWIVVSGLGGVAERNDFIDFIRKGQFKRKTMILSEPRVRLYGNTALVTTHLSGSGHYVADVSKCSDFNERQTDVLVWKNKGWKSVLLHETLISLHRFRCSPVAGNAALYSPKSS
jgi:hypothetical protein